MDRDEVLRKIMRHAITGHNDAGFHTYCVDSEHAKDILQANLLILRPTLSRSETRRIDDQLQSEAEDRFVYEGGSFAPR